MPGAASSCKVAQAPAPNDLDKKSVRICSSTASSSGSSRQLPGNVIKASFAVSVWYWDALASSCTSSSQLPKFSAARCFGTPCRIIQIYAKSVSRSHDAVIRVYDESGNVIETHEHKGDFNEC